MLIECIQGNVLFSNELSRRYADQGIVSVSLNPGNLKTDLQRYVPGVVRAILARSTPFPPLVTNVLIELDPVPGGIRRVDAAVGRHDRRGQDSRGEGAFRSIVVFFLRSTELMRFRSISSRGRASARPIRLPWIPRQARRCGRGLRSRWPISEPAWGHFLFAILSGRVL